MVLLPAHLLAPTPSFEEGISSQEETKHRSFGCQLISASGISLRLPQVVMVLAQTLLHRFYYRVSLKEYDVIESSMGCLFLAAKMKEKPRRDKDILNVYHALCASRQHNHSNYEPLDLMSERYLLLKKSLFNIESTILTELGFAIAAIEAPPHTFLLYFINVLDGSKALAQRSWSLCNDIMYTDAIVRYSPQILCCAAILLSSRQLEIPLPQEPPWYRVFLPTRNEVRALEEVLERFYMFMKNVEKVEWITPLSERGRILFSVKKS